MTKKSLVSKLQAYFKKHMPLDPRWDVTIRWEDEIEGDRAVNATVYRFSEYFSAIIKFRNDLNTEQLLSAFRHEYLHLCHSDIHMLRTTAEEISNHDLHLISAIRLTEERVVTTTEWFLDRGKGPLSMEALTLLFDGGA